MPIVKEDILQSYLRARGKNIDISNSRIKALIGSEEELLSANISSKNGNLSNLCHHLMEFDAREVMPNDEVPYRTVGYVVIHKRWPSFATYVLRDKPCNEISSYQYLVNMQGGYERWN